MATCPGCGGRGYEWVDTYFDRISFETVGGYKKDCNICHGSGQVRKVWTEEYKETCYMCEGSGVRKKEVYAKYPDGTTRYSIPPKIITIECFVCNGRGKITRTRTCWKV